MFIWASDEGRDILGDYVAYESLTLEFVVAPEDTKMFRDMGDDAYKFEQEAMTLNSHSYSVDPTKFTSDASLSEFYKLTSISYTPVEGNPFGATIEAYDYPFFGT